MDWTTNARVITLAAAAVTVALPGVAAAGHHHHDDADRLVGRAVLDANTYAPGPPAGAALVGNPNTDPDGDGVINGIQFPTPSQPVEGFSSIVEGRQRGEYLAMPDNGFGTKVNSRDFHIRAYYIRPDFKTAGGGSGAVDLGDYIEFTDPNHLIGFPIVNEDDPDRVLTGGDIDPESLQVGRRGDLWVGDEFGPWILHFDHAGRLLERPIAMPNGIVGPDNPIALADPTKATINRSKGLEGMGMAGRYLYPTLEGATLADLATDPLRRWMFEYDTKRGEFTARQWVYRVDPATLMVSDVAPLDRHRLVVVERDGPNPVVRRAVYVVDLRDLNPDGSLHKRLVLDLTAIPDPDLVSLPPIRPGDVGIGPVFSVVCESAEAARVVGHDELLIGCDNNFPQKGRNPSVADDNEFVVVHVPDL